MVLGVLGVIPLQNGVRVTPDSHNGFVSSDARDPRFTKTFKISLSADAIDPFFHAAVPAILPDKAYAILTCTRTDGASGKQTDEEYLTPFVDRDSILTKLAPYTFRVIHDGNIAFGIGWYSERQHEEIFMNQKRIITVMTSKPAAIERVVHDQGIEAFVQPKFITDYETANGDLHSFAEVYPEQYGKYRSDEYLTPAYLPGLIQVLSFRKN
jgi:hypothetical protein